MKSKKNMVLIMVFLFGILMMLSFISAPSPYTRSYVQYSSPGTYSGVNQQIYFDQTMCEKTGQDFLIQIAPLGCSPSVVRSDLLEEQDVPVFCPLSATKLNPLISVEAIDNINIGVSGKYPPEVSSFGFHSARDALRNQRVTLDSPVLDNIGYAIITLKRQPNESAMPEFVTGNLTAKIRYDIQNAFGVGNAEFYVPELTDEEWNQQYSRYGFWQSRGYLRAESVEENAATISLYSDVSGYKSPKNKVTSVRLEEGETSNKIYLPGMGMCFASLELKLNSLEAADTRARIRVNSDVFELAEKERFLDNKCQLKNLAKQGLVHEVDITCKNDEGRNIPFELKISPKVSLKIDGGDAKNYSLGDVLYKLDSERKVFLGYLGQDKKTGKIFIIPVASPHTRSEDFLNSLDIETLEAYTSYVEADLSTGVEFVDIIVKIFQAGSSGGVRAFNTLVRGVDYGTWVWMEEEKTIKFMSEEIRTEYFTNTIGFTKWVASGFDKSIKRVTYPQKTIEFVSLAEPQNMWDMEDLTNIGIYEKNFKTNYTKAFTDYQKTIESYSGEEYMDNGEKITLGEHASFEQIKLATSVSQFATVNDLCKVFKDSYPLSKKPIKTYCDDELKFSNDGISTEEIIVDGKVKLISLDEIHEPTFEEYGVEVYISGAEGDYNGKRQLRKDQRLFVSKDESIVLKELDTDKVVFDVREIKETRTQDLTVTKQFLEIDLEDYGIIGEQEYKIKVEKINLKKSAKVSVISGIKPSGTEVDFSFNIGIEKRAQILTPDQIENRIEVLDKNIGKWENISENFLAPTIKLGKTACLAAGAWLTASNFWENAKGKGISRQTIMRSSGGWYEICTDLVTEKEFKTKAACLLENSEEIEKDVEALEEIRLAQDENIKEIESWNLLEQGKGLFKEEVVNTDEFMKNYTENVTNLLQKLVTEGYNELKDPNKQDNILLVSEMIPRLSYEEWGKAIFSINDLREAELHARILLSSPKKRIENISKETLYKIFSQIILDSAGNDEQESFAQSRGFDEGTVSSSKDLKKIVITETKTFSEVSLNYPTTNPITDEPKPTDIVYPYKDRADGKEYLLILDNEYVIQGTFLVRASMSRVKKRTLKDLTIIETPNPLGLDVQMYNAASYENKFKEPQVRFYEVGDYAGLPGIVPFDIENGWYAATKSHIPVSGSLRAYDASGRVSSFYLCNVGRNNREEFHSGIGDDDCAMINLGTGHPYDQFPGLEPSKASELVNNAINAIKEASDQRQRNPKINCVDITGVNSCVSVGPPALDTPDIKCEDFMSPKDCNLIFNFCDPVVCPPSRCNYGGAYYVKDVIQSGIVGSSLLCLPNRHEGIKVPVCLTGIKAGIDGLLSVEKSYKQCLGDTLEKGETAGICDEVHSVYMCDFFWRQGVPLAKIALPNIAENILQQGLRGGGEYLGVQDAWTKAQASANLFTQYYAENSFSSFKFGSTAEIGSSVCKNFVSAKFPSGGDLIDSLTEPDSPAQFHGRFDLIPYTSVTNPPTTHYKVFYHIYAGAETGAYYRVYLTGGQEGTFYEDATGIRMVNSSYIPAGGYASATIDFLAPQGYKQLCINVNGQEECGFKEVSTSFAVDYITEAYLADQADQKTIQTTSECVSGTASALSLLNPNSQSGVEEYIDPAIYNKGIIRFCATDNPGKATDITRWAEVGYCDNQKMKCWLDTKSVDEVVNVPNLFTGQDLGEQVAEDVAQNYVNILINRDGYLSQEEATDAINQIKEEKEPLKKISSINDILEKIFFQKEKGQMHLLRGDAYREIAMGIYSLLTFKGKGTYIVEQVVYTEQTDLEAKPGTEEYKESASLIRIYVLDLNDKKLEFAANAKNSLLNNPKSIYPAFGRITEYVDVSGTKVNFKEIKLSEVQKGDRLKMTKEGMVEDEENVFEQDNFISNVFIYQDGTGKGNLYYQFYQGRWRISSDEEEWVYAPEIPIKVNSFSWPTPIPSAPTIIIREISDKSKEFIKELEGKNYPDGLELLIKRTREDENEGSGFWGGAGDLVGGKPFLVVEDEVEMDSDALFIILRDKASVLATQEKEDQEISYKKPIDMYVRFGNSGWEWSFDFDKENWMTPTEEEVDGGEYDGEAPSLSNILMLRELSRFEKGFYEGAAIIFSGEFLDVFVPTEKIEEGPITKQLNFLEVKLSDMLVKDVITTSTGIFKVERIYPIEDEGLLVIKVLDEQGLEVEFTRSGKDFLLNGNLFPEFGEIVKYERTVFVAERYEEDLANDFEGLIEPTKMNRLEDFSLLGRLSLYNIIMQKAESDYGVPKPLIQAIIIQESYADAKIGLTDNKGSHGLMQVSVGAALDVKKDVKNLYPNKKEEHAELFKYFNETEEGKYDPETNIFLGTAYYSSLRHRYRNSNSPENIDKIALMAYNWGLGNIKKHCPGDNFKNCNKEKVPSSVFQYASNILSYASELEKKRDTRFVVYLIAKDKGIRTIDEAIFIWDKWETYQREGGEFGTNDEKGEYWKVRFPKKIGKKTYNLDEVESIGGLGVGKVNQEIIDKVKELLAQNIPEKKKEKVSILKVIAPTTQAPVISQPVIIKSEQVKIDTFAQINPDTGRVEVELFLSSDSLELGYLNPPYYQDSKQDTIPWGIFSQDSLSEIFGDLANEEIAGILDADSLSGDFSVAESTKGVLDYNDAEGVFIYIPSVEKVEEPIDPSSWDTGELIITQCPPEEDVEVEEIVTGETCQVLQKEERDIIRYTPPPGPPGTGFDPYVAPEGIGDILEGIGNLLEYIIPAKGGVPGLGFDTFEIPVLISFDKNQEVFISDSLATDEIVVQVIMEEKTNEKGEIVLEKIPNKIVFTDSNGVALNNFEFSIVDQGSGRVVSIHKTTIVGQALVRDTFESIFGEAPQEILIPEYEGPETVDMGEVNRRINEIVKHKVAFQEYCSLNVDWSGDNYCAEYVTQVFDYIFDGGRSYLIGVTGNAKNFKANMLAKGASRIYDDPTSSRKFTNYNSLKKGDIIGLGRSSYAYGYTHVAISLGKINGNQYITHKIGDEIYTQPLESLDYFWDIRMVLRPNQENLYFTPVGYKNKYGFVLIKYKIKGTQGNVLGDTLGSVARRFAPSNQQHQGAIMWMIRDFTGRDIVRAGTIVEIYAPADSLGEVTADYNLYTDLKQGLYNAVSFRMDQEELSKWEEGLEFAFKANDFEKTPENFALVLAVIEKESSFYENPDLDMKGTCEKAIHDYVTNPEEASWGRWKACSKYWDEAIAIKTEKDYVDSVFQKGNLLSNTADFVWSFFGSDKFATAKLTSAGPMQVNIETALKLSEEDNERISEEEMYGYLFTIPGGLYYGVKNLKPILETYPLEEDLNNIEFVFADYNSGLYKSRNAAFQNRINFILGRKELQEDGVLGIKTARELNKILGREIPLSSNGRIAGSDIKSFEESSIYKRISTEYKKKAGQDIIYAIVPDITTESIKYDIPLTVTNYVKNSLKFFDRHCGSMKNCNVNKFLEQRQNKINPPEIMETQESLTIIDPGHGGGDPGRVVGSYKEADFNLEISKMLRDNLVEEGSNVILTREFNSEVNFEGEDFNGDGKVTNVDDLLSRANFAEKNNAKNFISIHSNYNADSAEIRGTEIYVYCYCSQEDLTNGKVDICQDLDSCLNKDSRYRDSLELATKMAESLDALGFEIRLVAGMDATVLEKTTMPAILVEMGYLSNEQDLTNLRENPERYASALSDSLYAII